MQRDFLGNSAQQEIKSRAQQLANLVRMLKEDDALLELQEEFFDGSENPLRTKQ